MRSKSSNTITFNYNGIAVLNVFLAALIASLMIYFVVVSNIITASKYKVGLLNKELSNVTETNGLLTAQKLLTEDPSAVINFAQSQHMVEAKYVTHIFEESDVALQQ
ncbi:MAG: hypothetical protein AAB799_00230 [Patescibacteria group bacterium]